MSPVQTRPTQHGFPIIGHGINTYLSRTRVRFEGVFLGCEIPKKTVRFPRPVSSLSIKDSKNIDSRLIWSRF